MTEGVPIGLSDVCMAADCCVASCSDIATAEQYSVFA